MVWPVNPSPSPSPTSRRPTSTVQASRTVTVVRHRHQRQCRASPSPLYHHQPSAPSRSPSSCSAFIGPSGKSPAIRRPRPPRTNVFAVRPPFRTRAEDSSKTTFLRSSVAVRLVYLSTAQRPSTLDRSNACSPHSVTRHHPTSFTSNVNVTERLSPSHIGPRFTGATSVSGNATST